ncbi:TetR/AcrR family transcriptional regulator [Burkholderiaceae bacterium]|nr:TetR/AcrR family transcriptional regulator [Burkholderiaceae bacterium]
MFIDHIFANSHFIAIKSVMPTKKSKSAKRTSYHHGDLSQALKNLAVDLIAKNGVDGFSMRQAAGMLGVAPSAVYRHYADKSELLKAICLDGFYLLGKHWLDLMDTHVAQVDSSPQSVSLARFSAGADAYFLFALEHPVLFQLMYGPFGTGSEGWTLFTEKAPLNPYSILGSALDELRDAQVISERARVNAEVLAYAAIHGVSSLAVSGAFRSMNEAELWEQLEVVKSNLLGGLRNEDVLVAPKTEVHIDLQSKAKRLKRSFS